MKKARKNVQIGLGAASILMIFVILCMMILSVLAYANAKQNERIAQREVNYKESYYKADCKAEIIFALFQEKQTNGSTMETLLEQPQILQALQDEGIRYTIKGATLQLFVHVNDQQELQVILEKTDIGILKKSWKLVATGGQSS